MHKLCQILSNSNVDRKNHKQFYPQSKMPKNVENGSYTRSYSHYPQKFSTFIMLITIAKTNECFGNNS